MDATFGERLRELRKEAGLGQIALAEKLGVGKSVISLWELNKCEPTLSNLVAIARFFDVSLDWLAGLKTDSPSDGRTLRRCFCKKNRGRNSTPLFFRTDTERTYSEPAPRLSQTR